MRKKSPVNVEVVDIELMRVAEPLLEEIVKDEAVNIPVVVCVSVSTPSVVVPLVTSPVREKIDEPPFEIVRLLSTPLASSDIGIR